MEGKTRAEFRCPCTDIQAPKNVEFWVELEGPGGWPSLLSGRWGRVGVRGVWPSREVWPQPDRFLEGVILGWWHFCHGLLFAALR